MALHYNHLDIVEWLIQRNIFPAPESDDSDEESEEVIIDDNDNLINHLHDVNYDITNRYRLSNYENRFLLSIEGANMAAQYGWMNILQWLSQFPRNILPDIEGANDAAQYGQLDVLIWLSQPSRKILRDIYHVNRAAGYGELEVL